jgi:hypothetical protein
MNTVAIAAGKLAAMTEAAALLRGKYPAQRQQEKG